jgi:hypothetical protein
MVYTHQLRISIQAIAQLSLKSHFTNREIIIIAN